MHTGFINYKTEALFKQPEIYGCGAAAFKVVCNLWNRQDISYQQVCKVLNPQPRGGVEQNDITSFAQKTFEDAQGGYNFYTGGLAILSMTHYEVRPKGSGHYVVALGVEKNADYTGKITLPPGEQQLDAAQKAAREKLLAEYAPQTHPDYADAADYVIRYYCPWLDQVFTKPFDDLVWVNGGRDYVHWSCNFPGR